MSLITSFFNYYQKWGWENKLGLSARTHMARWVGETFVRRSFAPDYENLMAQLLDPLDEISRAVVKKVIERHYYIFTNNLLQHKRLFDAQELANRQILDRVLPGLAAELNIPTTLTEASVLYYHHGLRHTDLPVDLFKSRFAAKDIIDVGAAIGDSAYIFHKFYQSRRIHSFEPGFHRLPLLRDFVARHQLDRVSLIEAALGPEKGTLAGGEPVLTMDDYVAEHGIPVGLIKMDVEGFENTVLAGAGRTLREQKPILIVSMYHDGNQFFDLLPQIQALQPEYQFAVRKIDDRSPVYETTLFAW